MSSVLFPYSRVKAKIEVVLPDRRLPVTLVIDSKD